MSSAFHYLFAASFLLLTFGELPLTHANSCDATGSITTGSHTTLRGTTFCLTCSGATGAGDWTIGSLTIQDAVGLDTATAFNDTLLLAGFSLNVYFVSCMGSTSVLSVADISTPDVDQPDPVHEGGNLTLTCRLGGTTPAIVESINWLSPNGSLLEENMNRLSLELNLNDITREQTGTYTCRFNIQTVEAEDQTTSINVTVYYAPSISTAIPSPHLAPQNSTLLLTCSFDSLPPPNITWTHNASPLDEALFEYTETDTELTLSSLQPADTGTYSCTATNEVGVDSATIYVLVQVPPDPPSDVMHSAVTSNSLQLSWTNGFDGNSSITGAVVRYRPDEQKFPDEEVMSVMVTEPPYESTSLSSLIPFTNHSISVSLVNAVGEGSPASITVKTLSIKPEQPVITEFKALSSQSLNVMWELSSFDHLTTAPVTEWILTYSKQGDPQEMMKSIPPASIQSPFITSMDLTELEKGTSYTVQVVAVNTAGESQPSGEMMTETAVDPPSEPTMLKVDTINFEILQLMWAEPEDNGGRPIQDYRIQYQNVTQNGNGTQGVVQVLESVDGREFMLTGLQDNTTYMINVSARNSMDLVGNPVSVEGTTLSLADPQPILTPPTGTGVPPTHDTATISWPHPGGVVTVFIVRYRPVSEGARRAVSEWSNRTVNGSMLSVTLTDLLPETRYESQVASRNSLGISAFSPIFLFMTAVPPIPPSVTIIGPQGEQKEGTTVSLLCQVKGLEGLDLLWSLQNQSSLPEGAVANGSNLTFSSVLPEHEGVYICAVGDYSDSYDLDIAPGGGSPVSPEVIIAVSVVGGVALALLLVAIVIAVCYFCCFRNRSSKDPYAPNSKKKSNWIEASVGGSYIPKTQQGSFKFKNASEEGGFDYPEDYTGHSSFNTLDKEDKGEQRGGAYSVAPGGERSEPYSNTVV